MGDRLGTPGAVGFFVASLHSSHVYLPLYHRTGTQDSIYLSTTGQARRTCRHPRTHTHTHACVEEHFGPAGVNGFIAKVLFRSSQRQSPRTWRSMGMEFFLTFKQIRKSMCSPLADFSIHGLVLMEVSVKPAELWVR